MAQPARQYVMPSWVVTPEQARATDETDAKIRTALLARALPLLEGEEQPAEGGGSGAAIAFLLGLSPILLILNR